MSAGVVARATRLVQRLRREAEERRPLRSTITLLGDSIIEQLGPPTRWFGRDAVRWTNAGTGGARVADVQARAAAVGTSACVVLAGINDVWDVAAVERAGHAPPTAAARAATAAHVVAGLAHLIAQLRQRGVAPVMVTLLPLARSYPNADAFNAIVRDINAVLADGQTPLVDVYSAFVGSDGYGLSHLYRDGIHPNRAGRRVVTATLAVALCRLEMLR